MADEDVVAVKLTVVSPDGKEFVVYAAPDKARYASKLQIESGNSVTQEELTEMPKGVELDIP
jgi:hypothetical protein